MQGSLYLIPFRPDLQSCVGRPRKMRRIYFERHMLFMRNNPQGAFWNITIQQKKATLGNDMTFRLLYAVRRKTR